MVLGETEITGQIKNAYEIARIAGLTGRIFNRLFQKAFQTTKEIRTRTGIGRGAVSVKSAAVELVGRTLGDFSSSIMVIGAGEMADSCVRSLTKKGARSILISNRSFDRALDLAIRCGGEAICLGDCLFGMRDVDVVIVATSSVETLLGVASHVAWKQKPSWYKVAGEDHTINPDLERLMAQRAKAKTTVVKSPHVAMFSRPKEVLAVILEAVQTVSK